MDSFCERRNHGHRDLRNQAKLGAKATAFGALIPPAQEWYLNDKMRTPTSNKDAPLLLYDGTCGLCNKSVQTVLKYDRRGTMQFAPLQSEPGKEIVARHPELADIDSVVFVETSSGGKPERVFVRSDAALRVLDYLGGAWKVLSVGRVVPRRIRDFVYDLFAKHRYRFFGRYDSCLLPPPEVRSRFLE